MVVGRGWEQPWNGLSPQLGKRDQDCLGGRTGVRVSLLQDLKAGAGKRPLQPFRAGRGIPEQQNAGSGRPLRRLLGHTRKRTKWIG